MNFAIKTLTPMIAIGLGLTGCVDPNDIKEIKRNQKKILDKLEQVETKIGKGGDGKPSRPQPKRPDPRKVYSFSVGESHAKGPKDAWVTVFEVSDFQ